MALKTNVPIIFAVLDSVVQTTAISPDERWVIAGLDNGTLQRFDLQNGTPIGQPFQGHTFEVTSVAFSPDGQRIVIQPCENYTNFSISR